MKSFTIMPLLGRRTDVPSDDSKCFIYPDPNNPGLCYTHDVGGLNFDLARKKRVCVKSKGHAVWSNTATAAATKCLGLFELYDGANRNHVFVDNGNVYIYDSSRDPVEIEDAGTTEFAKDDVDLYSFVRVGDYMIFSDRGEHTPYKWKHGDATLTKAIASGTEYKFRYLSSFSRRLFGLYSDQTDGNIDIRYSTAWPDTAITSLNYPAANQLWVPTDDTITGGAVMGDYLYIYCDGSIQQVVYYPDYSLPFKVFPAVPRNAGFAGHHSIVNLGDRHFGYNKSYGFCEYRGGRIFPYGAPISESIEEDIAGINQDYADLIVGVFNPIDRKIVWTVPADASGTPNKLFFYNIDTGHWEIEDKTARCLDMWRFRSTYSWNNLITDYGTGVTWGDLGNIKWSSLASIQDVMSFGNTDGILYYRSGETSNGSAIEGYRIEPVLSFGNPRRRDTVEEIWFSFPERGAFSVDVYIRSGETVGEVENAAWVSIGSISADDPSEPKINVNTNAHRLHQIKWGTDLANEKFSVNRITLKYNEGSDY